MEKEKSVDESWKQSVSNEKEEPQEQQEQGLPEVNFLSYVTSLAFQAMIFLGEIPNPMVDNKVDQNLPQAKFLIDTLALLRDKTKGNLSKEEDDMLNASIYELQMKFVEHSKKDLTNGG